MAIPAKYIHKIAQMFTRYGIRNVTMDHIAREIEYLKKHYIPGQIVKKMFYLRSLIIF
ncbi:MAG: hypothetical protein IPH17_05835 [Bacteroidales bacterium]|nr:hypothetical protein [Bacteroidales bacterium]